jgi:hypothetical protein
MANNQMPLIEGDEDIIQQVEAYSMAGVSRAVLRGCIDRGELRIADHKGSRGSARLYRSDVLRLASEKGWSTSSGMRAVPTQASGDECRQCSELRAARMRDAETIRRLRDALAAATA